MDTANFVETIGKSGLPFVYSGEKLNDEKCQKALKKIGGEGTVLGVIVGNALMGLEGLVVTEKGIWYALSNISTGTMGFPVKTKGAWLFDKFIIHKIVTVKKTPVLPSFEVELILWDIEKSKSSTIKIKLTVDNLEFKDSMVQELEDIFNTLTSKTGTEYVAPDDTQKAEGQSSQVVEKDPNTFDFLLGILNTTHTIIAVNDSNITIRRMKIDNKTSIQTPKGNPITILRSAIGSVKLKRSFSILPLLEGMALGAGLGFGIFGGLIVFLLGTIIGLLFSFPKTMFIYRKDGTKFKTVVRGGEEEYERLINVIFS
jgi:hypothetical protein